MEISFLVTKIADRKLKNIYYTYENLDGVGPIDNTPTSSTT